MSFFEELGRRNVFKVAAAYAIIGWLIAQIATVFAPALDLPDWVARLVLFLLMLGFPVALVLAWAYEVTPQGIKKTRHVPLQESLRRITGQKLNYVVTAVLAAAVAFLVLDNYVLEQDVAETNGPRRMAHELEGPVAQASQSSVAVLPFANMSSDSEQDYFADGLSEELTNVLAGIHNLRVAGRTSAFSFKGKSETLRSIGAALDVEHVLEGSVRKAGDRVRITAQLINANDGYHLWSSTFDRELDDIFAIQEEIARAVAGALEVTLGVGELGRRPGMTRNVEAYDAYLLGMSARAAALIPAAIDHFERAIALDPEFGLAWIELSTAYRLAVLAISNGPHEEWSARATQALFRARELTPQSRYILAVEAGNNAQAWGNWLEAGRILETLQETAADAAREPGVSMMQGRLLLLAGRPVEAVRELERARSIDPLALEVALDLARAYASSSDLPAAIAEVERAATFGGAPALSILRLQIALAFGDRTGIEQSLGPLAASDPTGISAAMGEFLADSAAARRVLMRLAAEPRLQAPLPLASIAFWAAHHGHPSLALEVLRRRPPFVAGSATMVYFTIWGPSMSEVRRLPGFKDLVRYLGLVDYWREFGWSDFCHPTGDDDFACE